MEELGRLRVVADYQFGRGAGELLIPQGSTLERSKKTGRPRHIYHQGELVASYRPNDGLLTLTIAGATRLANLPGLACYVVASEEAVEFVEEGKTLFAKHVVEAGPDVRPGDEVVVKAPDGKVIAVGKALLSSGEMEVFQRGVAVKVRRGRARHR